CKDGVCNPGAKKACTSEDACVVAKCDITNGNCKYTKNVGQPCNDGNPCTAGDKCGGPDGDVCQGGDTNCDDKNPCTADTWDSATAVGCVHTPVGAACDDGNACTVGDACAQGVCGSSKAIS